MVHIFQARAAALALILAAPLASAPASAQSLLALCGDADAPARQVAGFCRRALDGGGLSPAQEAAAAVNLGAALLDLDQPRQAEQAYARALAADPRSALAFAGRARARAAQGMTPLAAVDWNRALDLAPRDRAIRAELHAGRGAFRLRAGNAQGALADFEAALRADPRSLDAQFNRGVALAALGRDAEAEAAFSAVLRRDGDDLGAWINRARLRASGDRDAALRDFDEAVRRAPEWALARFERGLLLEAMGREEAAALDYRRAFELGHRSDLLAEKMLRLGR